MSLLAGILVGFVLAIPPGGVQLVGLNLSMTLGFRKAMPYAYGIMLVDIMYALLAVMAAKTVIEFHEYTMSQFPVLILFVQGLLISGLFGYGLYLLSRRSPLFRKDPGGEFASPNKSSRIRRQGPFLLGFALNLSNIFSPTFIAALAILGTQAQMFGVLEGEIVDGILYAAGFGIGNTIYIQLAMKFTEKYAHRLKDRHVLKVQKVAGAAFAGIGALLLIHVVTMWAV